MNEDKKGKAAHRLTMEGREKLTISGVEDVVSFDEHEILLDTLEGTLLLRERGCTSISSRWKAASFKLRA